MWPWMRKDKCIQVANLFSCKVNKKYKDVYSVCV